MTWRKCVQWWAWHTQRCAELRSYQEHLQSVRAAVTLANCFYDWYWEVQVGARTPAAPLNAVAHCSFHGMLMNSTEEHC
jgi:hypothetical protein